MDYEAEVLGVRETARRLGVHENTVRAYAKRGLLPDARVPGTSAYKFRATDVERLRAQRGAPAETLIAERQTASPELATASQLAAWPRVHAREAQDRLPELVRRLLFETPGAGQISIRTRDGVALAGADGAATLEHQTQCLPAGRVRFEFGTDQDPKRKATKDYEARREEASQDVTFVFVTIRRWQGKDRWASQQRAERLYKDVLVLDADDLEAWLQTAPAAHIWISETLGLRPSAAVTLETWWERTSAATQPALPDRLFLAGRQKQAQLLRSLLADQPRITSVQTEWLDDALGFIHGCLATDDATRSVRATVTIVRSAEVWDRIVALSGTGILVPDFDNADITRAIDSGRHVIAIIDSDSAARRTVDVRLPRVARDEAADAFRACDIDWRRADRLAALARRSMPALVRHFSSSPRAQQPRWSRPPVADTLAALMLAGSWTERPEDLQIISDLTATSPDDLRRAITDASQGPDPAIRNVREVSVLSSLEEAFLELGSRVSSPLASRWAEIATKVLMEPNPYEGLNSHERIAAQLKGHRPPYSSALRNGIAKSIALAAAIEPPADWTDHASTAARRVVDSVLHSVIAGSEGCTWETIADVLPLLAEAAPDTFLSALEDDLAASEPTVRSMFGSTDDRPMLGPSSPHHHLLWALEVLCWSPDHLVRAMQILTSLCQFDLPKNSANTPLASMSTVLCGWVRNTGADLTTRLQAIDACRFVDESVAWALLKALWPDPNSWVSPPSEPLYQLWKPSSTQTSTNEWFLFIKSLCDRALVWVEADQTDLPWLINGITTVGPVEANRILEFLEEKASAGKLDVDVQLALFEQARETATHHRRFHDAGWAMPADRLNRLEELVMLLEPLDDERRFAYLFGWHPDLSDANMDDYENYRAALEAKRREALDALFSRPNAWEKLEAIALRAEAPTQIGWALSTYGSVDALDTMLEWLGSESAAPRDAAAAWVRSHLAVDGPADLRRALERSDISSESLKRFVLNIPTSSRFWTVLREFPSAHNLYWTETPFEVVPSEDVTEAVESLLDRSRAWSAIIVASHGIASLSMDHNKHRPASALVLSALRAAMTQDPFISELPRMIGHQIGILLDYLATAGVEVTELAWLEFGYFRLLEHSREPRALNQTLASDPALFVDLVRRAFRGSDGLRSQSESADPLTEHAWWVLRDWTGYPGRQEDGTLDEAQMREWVSKARFELAELDRSDIGDELIGGTFAHAPADPDGVWPPRSVRDLIELIGSHHLENGVVIGRLNSRGVTWRGVYDGGVQERTLSEQHKRWGGAVQGQWPRTARILRAIADSYERDAIRQDARAQIDQDLD